MIALAYIIPLLACLLLPYLFNPYGRWEPYAIVAGAGYLLTGLTHWLCYRARTKCREFLGGYIVTIYYEAPWTEIVIVTQTYTDKRGNTHTRRRKEYVYHPEKYYFDTNLGTRHNCSDGFFDSVRSLWQVVCHEDVWYGSEISGGSRRGCNYDYYDARGSDESRAARVWTVTEPHKYTNKIRNSNSIFRFEKIGRTQAITLGLIDYPEIIDFDAPTILSDCFDVPETVERQFRLFNSVTAPEVEMHLFVLLFDASRHGVDIVEKQRAYWHGGNKNEFVVCLGVERGETKWARAFSWVDEPVLEVKTADWFLKNPKADLADFLEWLYANYSIWQRKHFSDFNYIRVNLTMWQVFLTCFAAAAGCALGFLLLNC